MSIELVNKLNFKSLFYLYFKHFHNFFINVVFGYLGFRFKISTQLILMMIQGIDYTYKPITLDIW